jgi:hypothetical protein
MKKTTYILLFIILSALVSCEDFLDKKPLDAIGSDTELNNNDAIALINAAYQPLQWAKLYNMRMWTTDVIANESLVGGDMSSATDGIETKDLASFIATSDNEGSLDLWRGPNPGILRCNIVLDRIPNMEGLDPAIRDRVLGEAYFLRAHYYFIMVRIFGDVPLRTTPVEPGDGLHIARTPKAQVYDQIISDCRNAIDLLPPKNTYSAADLGRACKEATLAMLAKVYLTLGTNYGEVVSLCEEIENMGYDLRTMKYDDNFNPTIKNNAESLFEIQYTGATDYGFWDNANQASWLSTFMGPRGSGWVGGSWGWQHVTPEFVGQYEPNDLRKDVTILYAGCPQFEGQDYDPSWSSTGYNVRKFLVPKSISPDFNTNPSNFVVYRFADVLLMKAEALNEQGLTQQAQAPLNTVRTRAGLPNITTTDKAVMKEAIIKERRIELAFEGHRWFDLIRIDNGDYAFNFFRSIGKTNVTKERLLWPVPQAEIDDNPLITQNPGY